MLIPLLEQVVIGWVLELVAAIVGFSGSGEEVVLMGWRMKVQVGRKDWFEEMAPLGCYFGLSAKSQDQRRPSVGLGFGVFMVV